MGIISCLRCRRAYAVEEAGVRTVPMCVACVAFLERCAVAGITKDRWGEDLE